MGLDGEVGESIWRVKGKIYKETDISSAISRQKNENGSRYIRLYYGRGVIYKVWE